MVQITIQRNGNGRFCFIFGKWIVAVLVMFVLFAEFMILRSVRRDGAPSADGSTTNEEFGSCTVYMAPSSVHGVDGMGIYTTKNLSKNDVIINKVDGLSIPVLRGETDYVNDSNKTIQARKQWHRLFNEYWWVRGISDQMIWEADRVADLKMTFGELPNHHCVLQSLFVRNPEKGYNDKLVNRTIDPGVGAFSYHIGREIFVKRDVQAGEEIFLNYGHCNGWREGSPDWTKNILSKRDYSEAGKVTGDTWTLLLGTKDNDEKKTEAQLKIYGTSTMGSFSACTPLLLINLTLSPIPF